MNTIPTSFQINVTHRCNSQCKHCYALRDTMDMPKETLQKVINHIVNIGSSLNKYASQLSVTFTGGEMGLYNPTDIYRTMLELEARLYDSQIKFICITNLLYPITAEHMILFDNLHMIGTSYDFGNVRFTNAEQKKTWFTNLNRLIKEFGNKKIGCCTTVTQAMLDNISPEELIDMFYMSPLKNWEIQRFCLQMREEQTKNNYLIPKWEEVNEYLYRAFLRYLQYRDVLKIESFECMIDSFNGINWYEHGRNCQEINLTFSPNGNIDGCGFCQHFPIAHVDMTTDEIINSKERLNLIQIEKQLPEKCLKCKWVDKCKGDCFRMEWQGDVCPTPYKIYEYLEEHPIE